MSASGTTIFGAASGGCGAGSSGGGGGGGSAGNGPCGACKFLRRKCVPGCIFAPYFDQEQGAAYFAAVHKVFGASNVSKLLHHIPEHRRLDTVVTVCYEAQARLRDPVYGCISHIIFLQQQVLSLQSDISYLHGHIAGMQMPAPPRRAPPPANPMYFPLPLSIADLPSTVPPTYDLSSVLEPVGQAPWIMQQQANEQMYPGQYEGNYVVAARIQPPLEIPVAISEEGDELEELARELLESHAPPLPTVPMHTAGST